MSVTHKKPTTEHWRRFAKSIAKKAVFAPFMDKAFTQAFWTYVRGTEAMELFGSTVTAQQNATLVMMFLHTLRLVFGKLIQDKNEGVLSLTFLTKMAAVKSDKEMDTFVDEEFVPKVTIDGLEKIPNFDQAKPVMEAMFAQWKTSGTAMHRKQVQWISTIRTVHDKLASIKTNVTLMKGLHELIASIHFMIVTSPKAVLNHYPCMASLGMTTKHLNKFCQWNKYLFETISEVKSLKHTLSLIISNI